MQIQLVKNSYASFRLEHELEIGEVWKSEITSINESSFSAVRI